MAELLLREIPAYYDFSTSPPQVIYRELERGTYGTAQCPTTVAALPPPGKSWNEHWITNCFAALCTP